MTYPIAPIEHGAHDPEVAIWRRAYRTGETRIMWADHLVAALPGTREAIDTGCRCPVIDNHKGRGYGGNGEKYGWITVEDCTLHGWHNA